MTDAPHRPRQVTLAAWMIMGGSALIVALVFERVAGLGSLETQRSIETFLSEPPGEGLGLDLDGVTTILRILAMVAGACATAAAILGFHVLQRSRGARLALAVLAVPLFVSGMAAGGLLPAVVVAAAVMLWLQPARDWFDGITPAPEEREGEPVGPSMFQSPPPPPPPVEPRAMSGFGSTPAPTTVRTPAPMSSRPPADRAAGRPPALLWACVLTWTFCGLAILVMGLSALVLLAAPDVVFEELYRQNPDLRDEGISDSEVRTATLGLAGVLLVWGGAAIGFAVQAFRRVRWARTALLVSAAGAAAVSLVGAVVSIAMALPLVACLVTITLLVRPEVRAWFS
ncbi:hypothetical protein LRP67_04725 [Nocardioides sp. cx-169]|uniref:hypothetical protein n=1 Tax=Nocardioides sp. cx-169 TaxID=2899080 RepID=UPI001E38B14B|nr:hypothetical protein [Nocardioides sp. cx-169]MCD4533385.1 hypothetical protein [Nocardioides sp. cx-169]